MALADPWSDSLAVATPICAAVAPLNMATVSTASAATTAGKVPTKESGSASRLPVRAPTSVARQPRRSATAPASWPHRPQTPQQEDEASYCWREREGRSLQVIGDEGKDTDEGEK